jgi:hypothetical protein
VGNPNFLDFANFSHNLSQYAGWIFAGGGSLRRHKQAAPGAFLPSGL